MLQSAWCGRDGSRDQGEERVPAWKCVFVIHAA